MYRLLALQSRRRDHRLPGHRAKGGLPCGSATGNSPAKPCVSPTIMTDLIPRVGIEGAGIAGLSCAHVLREAGVPVTLFDKGREPGGRLSTRRGEFAFDHGAQYFTADDDAFRSAVAE